MVAGMSIIVIDFFYRTTGRLWLDMEIFFWKFLFPQTSLFLKIEFLWTEPPWIMAENF